MYEGGFPHAWLAGFRHFTVLLALQCNSFESAKLRNFCTLEVRAALSFWTVATLARGTSDALYDFESTIL